MTTGVIILAAGASTRMGEPKQTLSYKGRTLLQIAIDAAKQSGCKPIVVVVGANAKQVSIIIEGEQNILVAQNNDWHKGMGSSLQVGLKELSKATDSIENAIVMLCDQPHVDAGLLNRLVKEKEASDKEIVACAYNNTIGVPVLFHKSFFPQLLQNELKEGARSLLHQNKDSVAVVPFAAASIDIDTKEDYQQLLEL